MYPPHFPSSQSAWDSGCGSDLSIVICDPERLGGSGRIFHSSGFSSGILQDQIPEAGPDLKNGGNDGEMDSKSQEVSAPILDMEDNTNGPVGIGGNLSPISNFGSSVCSEVGTWSDVAVTVVL